MKEDAFESDANLKVVKYDRTPIMSTYLLAYVIGEYDYVEDTDSDGVKVRVYTPVGKKEQGQFALEVRWGFWDGFTELYICAYYALKKLFVSCNKFLKFKTIPILKYFPSFKHLINQKHAWNTFFK